MKIVDTQSKMQVATMRTTMLSVMLHARTLRTNCVPSHGNCSIFQRLDVLLVFDRVISTDPAFRKSWLLHGVDMPWIDGKGSASGNGEETFGNAGRFRMQEGEGEILVHTLLPASHVTSRRGGAGPRVLDARKHRAAAHGAAAATGRLNLRRAALLPTDPDRACDVEEVLRQRYSEHRALQPSQRCSRMRGEWRSPPPNLNWKIIFFMCSKLAIAERLAASRLSCLQGAGIAGAACALAGAAGIAAIFPAQDAPLDYVEVTLPSFPCHTLWIAGLEPDRHYDVELVGSNLATGDATAPGVPIALAGSPRQQAWHRPDQIRRQLLSSRQAE